MKIEMIVIGGGVAGMIAAITAKRNNKKVMILEKKTQLGLKLGLTGKGRCNLTNYSEVEEHIDNIPVNGQFMRNSLYRFSPFALLDFLKTMGIETKIERGNRVFPSSENAQEVRKKLMDEIERLKIPVKKEKVIAVGKEKDFYLKTNLKNTYTAQSVLIATGGKSYPSTGSTGDGFAFAKKFGHKIINPRQALVPLICEKKANKLNRLKLKNVKLTLLENNSQKYEDLGELEFIKNKITGPLSLSASIFIADNPQKYKIKLDLKPGLNRKELDARLIRDFHKFASKNFSNSLNNLLPKKMIPFIIEESGINPTKNAASITKKERQKLGYILKNLEFKIKSLAAWDEAIITSGGVSVNEINPNTMESRKIKNLYFAGEIIDVAAFTGGYNLQIAFSSGFVAGLNC